MVERAAKKKHSEAVATTVLGTVSGNITAEKKRVKIFPKLFHIVAAETKEPEF
ncbi:MAG: hypothetical protein PF501_10600 [Salinisphaera sp.]|jgi:hypothetical protein|nr:hypothetical protein [Salinisphaera sp.]